MSTHKHFDKICFGIFVVTLMLALLFLNSESLGVKRASSAMGYEDRLFNTSSVHTIDIVMDDWDDFISTCTEEKYTSCTLIIDGEAQKNVAIRGKGNTSLTKVKSYGNDRYSFKIEFDHYDSTKTYYGLDKLCLNNIIQDNTYIKDYLTYQMMSQMGVASPLCSYVNISVNGKPWGLYLAIEGVEESFLQRNYGKDYGCLYKPDSMAMGGGPGNGKDFKAEQEQFTEMQKTMENPPEEGLPRDRSANGNRDEKLNGSDDVLLKYIDDKTESYANIFNYAKTDISSNDKERLINGLKNLSGKVDLANTVNIESVVNYFVVHNFVLNFDSYTGSMIHNYYLYEKDGQMSMIPWDYNLAFGAFQSAGSATNLINYPIDSPISGGTLEDRPMLSWIFTEQKYTELYHQYFEKFLSKYFDSGELEEMIDSVKALISPYVKDDPTKFCSYEEFEKAIDTLKKFCLLRAESIKDQLNGVIGSTSETQKQQTFIDAGEIKISDMGTMGNDEGRDMDKPQGQPPERTSGEPQGQPPEGTWEKPQGQPPGGTSDKPQFQPPEGASAEPQSQGEKPKEQGFEQQTGIISPSSWIWLGICTAILILGIIFALLFKRRK